MHRATRMTAGIAAALGTVALLAAPAAAQGGNGAQASRKPVFDGVIYADGALYGTNGNGALPAPTDANRSSYDDLYLVTNGVTGQLPVAEAAPGPAYNGGRWAVVQLTWEDAAMAVELRSSAQVRMYLEAGALTATEAGVYFSCPLLPVK
ncbi:MAG TPA: hypothetical protein VF855_14960 [Acidimicrobiales bacterium]